MDNSPTTEPEIAATITLFFREVQAPRLKENKVKVRKDMKVAQVVNYRYCYCICIVCCLICHLSYLLINTYYQFANRLNDY